ncbi:hypothetical protein C7B67_07215 [filamentous cyanobacterium Phorm 6]|nr:hypothetical protein C7B67_07215 [filamentous cyanobacterium Phorm 6]
MPFIRSQFLWQAASLARGICQNRFGASNLKSSDAIAPKRHSNNDNNNRLCFENIDFFCLKSLGNSFVSTALFDRPLPPLNSISNLKSEIDRPDCDKNH